MNPWRRACWAVIVLAAAASIAPYVVAAAHLPDGADVYNWVLPPFPEDGLGYLAFVRQAMEGALLFKINFTAIPHAPMIFHPFFLVCGWLAALLGWSPGLTLLIVKTWGVLFLGGAILKFLDHFRFSQRESLSALLLMFFASGLGGWMSLKSIDLSDQSAILLWAITWNPLFPYVLILILQVIRLFDLGLNNPHHSRHFICAGMYMVLLTLLHPYDVVFVGATLIAMATTHWSRIKEWIRPATLYFAMPASVGVIGMYTLSKIHPVLAAHSQKTMTSDPPLAYVLGLGVLLGPALYGGWLAWRKVYLRPLVLWPLLALLLLYVPMWFQRKMTMGIMIPLSMLAAAALARLPTRLTWVAVALMLGLSVASHMSVLKNTFDELQLESHAFYYSNEQLAVAEYLDKNTNNSDVILTSLRFSRSLPSLSGNTVLFGHWAQSIDLKPRWDWVNQVYHCETCTQEVAQSVIDYVVIDRRLLEEHQGRAPIWLNQIARPVFANSYAHVFALHGR